MSNIHQMNGLKNWLSFALSAISVLAFALGGFVHWPEAIVMAVAATRARQLPRPCPHPACV